MMTSGTVFASIAAASFWVNTELSTTSYSTVPPFDLPHATDWSAIHLSAAGEKLCQAHAVILALFMVNLVGVSVAVIGAAVGVGPEGVAAAAAPVAVGAAVAGVAAEVVAVGAPVEAPDVAV